MQSTLDILTNAKQAKVNLMGVSTEQKNLALRSMAQELLNSKEAILSANAVDMDEAKTSINDVMLDRLALNEDRIEGMAKGILEVVDLPDPCNKILSKIERPNGLIIEKTSVPMGVIAIIYESRPNVTSDAAALAIKAGSACVLRAGKEAHRSAQAIVEALQNGLEDSGLPRFAVQLIEDTSRASAKELMEARGYVDLLIPRGGKGLIHACVENAKVPVLETGTGICHIYVDESADVKMAVRILENAKCSRPSVCNAAEVCLVHKNVADEFTRAMYRELVSKRLSDGLKPIELRLDARASEYIDGIPASKDDFNTEYNDYVLAVGIVDSIQDAVTHINSHSTGHSESIITNDEQAASYFTSLIDSAAVYVNASTRFTDGGEFGLGCEMGISTQKMHARGPLGLEELCSYKYIIRGNGQIR